MMGNDGEMTERNDGWMTGDGWLRRRSRVTIRILIIVIVVVVVVI